MLVSGRLGRLLLLLVAVRFMQSPMRDKITKMINWQLLAMFFFNRTTKIQQFYSFRQ